MAVLAAVATHITDAARHACLGTDVSASDADAAIVKSPASEVLTLRVTTDDHDHYSSDTTDNLRSLLYLAAGSTVSEDSLSYCLAKELGVTVGDVTLARSSHARTFAVPEVISQAEEHGVVDWTDSNDPGPLISWQY